MELLRILQVFDETEWKICSSFLKKKLRHTQKKTADKSPLLILFNFLEIHQQKGLSITTLDLAHQKFFPDKSKSYFQTICYRLRDIIKEGIILSEMEKENAVKLLLLSSFYNRKGLYTELNALKSEIEEELKELKPFDFFTNLKQLFWFHILFFSNLKIKNKINLLGKALVLLEAWYNNLKIHYQTEEENHKVLFNTSITFDEASVSKDFQLLLIRLDALVREKNAEDFEYVFSFFQQNLDECSHEVSSIIYKRLVNFCGFKIKIGDTAYREKLNQVYDFAIVNQLLLISGKLTEGTFLNIIEVKSRANSPNAALDFIEEWYQKVHTHHPDALKTIAIATYHFAGEAYPSAYELIGNLPYQKENHLTIRAKWMELCCRYSMREYNEEFGTVLESARKFFLRKKKDGLGNTTYRGSINLIKVLNKFYQNKDPKYIDTYKRKLDVIVCRDWIEKELKQQSKSKTS